MLLGLHTANFTWEGAHGGIAQTLATLARTAEDDGVARMTVMDHVWQISVIGPPEHEMLEAYTTLGYLAAVTSTVRLHTMVSAVTYRTPGLLAKIVTTLDVLSGGRAGLGIGAAWFEAEAHGLGLPFPPLRERFERLEETLQICLQMWSGEDAPYEGRHARLARTLNSPQSLTRPRPPILIGGGGEQRTLRLVARYADACNLFPSQQPARKLDVLREHCELEGRDFDTIEKTTNLALSDASADGVGKLLDELRMMHELGFTVGYVSLRAPDPVAAVELLGATVIPEIAAW
jgi:F420-dependent oxidoreductase-like protein